MNDFVGKGLLILQAACSLPIKHDFVVTVIEEDSFMTSIGFLPAGSNLEDGSASYFRSPQYDVLASTVPVERKRISLVSHSCAQCFSLFFLKGRSTTSKIEYRLL